MNCEKQIEVEVMRQNCDALQKELCRVESRAEQWKAVSWILMLVIGVMLFAILDLQGCIHRNPDLMNAVEPGTSGL